MFVFRVSANRCTKVMISMVIQSMKFFITTHSHTFGSIQNKSNFQLRRLHRCVVDGSLNMDFPFIGSSTLCLLVKNDVSIFKCLIIRR